MPIYVYFENMRSIPTWSNEYFEKHALFESLIFGNSSDLVTDLLASFYNQRPPHNL